ncbi:MAG TPA: hypothetical protein VMP11_19360 [Verrucomicrobiae bacterium]|nr:hypothetical protein [Verrucomicrobiae bacterium]
MIKLADASGLIWLIVIVLFTLAKGWSKLQDSKGTGSPETDDDEVPVRPKTTVPRPPLYPASRPTPRLPNPVSPTMRRTPSQMTPSSTVSERKVSADDIRRVMEQVSRKPQTAPAPPPIPSAIPPLTVPTPLVPMAEIFQPPAPAPALPAPAQSQSSPPAPPEEPPAPAQTTENPPTLAAEPARTSQWMEALRDRQNLRNIIVAAEIIGPPRSELV